MAETSQAPGQETAAPSLQIPMHHVVRFVRQLSHDLRNHLNAAELQSSYIGEVLDDPEIKSELQRLRGMLSELGASLHRLTTALGPVQLTKMPYDAGDFAEDLQRKIASDFPKESAAVDWDCKLAPATFEIDPQLLQEALSELFANAFRHGRAEGKISASAHLENERFVFTLREPKTGFTQATEKWGREPLGNAGQGHYGLGLHRTRAILEAHHGQLDARYDSENALLATTVTLPVVRGQN